MVSDYYTDFIGGGERSLASQIAALKAAGHRIFLIRPYQANQPAGEYELAVKASFTWRVAGSILPVTPHTPAKVRQIRTFLERNHIDIVHSQGQGGISYTTLLAAQALGIPFVDTIHTFFWKIKDSPLTRALHPIGPWFMSQILGYKVTPIDSGDTVSEHCLRGATLTFAQQVDLVISPSQHQRDALQAAGLHTRVECIPNPLDSQHTSPAVPLSSGTLQLAWIGRMNYEKRLPVLIDALRIVEQERPGKCRAVIIGDGPDRVSAQQRAANLPGVTFTGLQSQSTVLSTLDQSHILALTSYRFDNQPMVVTEAISRHRGVVYCDELLVPEIGEAGLLTEGHDAPAFAQSIIDCIDHPELLAKLSHACEQQVELFEPSAFVEAVTAAYRSLK